MIQKGLRYGIAYLMWGVALLSGLWLMHLGRQVFLGALSVLYVNSVSHALRARYFDKVYTLLLGLLWLVLMVATEAYFRAGAMRQDLLKRFARVVGPQFVLIFMADLILFWLQGIDGGGGWRWLVVSGEFSLGIFFVLLGWFYQTTVPSKSGPV